MNGAGNGEGEPSPSVVVVEDGVLEEGAPPNAAGNGDGGGGDGGVPPHAPNFGANESDTLLVVATLITALTYQLGTNIPGGYWQADDGAGHVAGDPIMRDKHRRRYWLFMAASWAGFGSSMLLTVGLITGVPPRSRFVQYAFLVAYSRAPCALPLLLRLSAAARVRDVARRGPLVNVIWVAVMAIVAIITMYQVPARPQASLAGRKPIIFRASLLVVTV